jgi:hypothetical protein
VCEREKEREKEREIEKESGRYGAISSAGTRANVLSVCFQLGPLSDVCTDRPPFVLQAERAQRWQRRHFRLGGGGQGDALVQGHTVSKKNDALKKYMLKKIFNYSRLISLPVHCQPAKKNSEIFCMA